MSPRLMICVSFVALAACQPTQTAIDPGSIDSAMGSGSADASTIDALSAAQACDALAKSRCEKLMSCSPADLLHNFGDVSTCETRDALACNAGEAAVDTGATPETALACAGALTAMTCGDFLASKSPPAACLPPAGPGNGTCAFAAQCVTSYCGIGAEALCGTCQDQPMVGTSCQNKGCGDALICAQATHLCEIPGTANSACDRTLPCGNGFSCVGAIAAQNKKGTCQAEVTTAGGTCDSQHKVKPGCSGDDGLTCNTATNKCVPKPLVAAGMPCGQINNVSTGCAAAASCVIAANQTVGTCVAPAADGAACDTKNGPDCFEPARCIPTAPPGTAGTCRFPGSQTCP